MLEINSNSNQQHHSSNPKTDDNLTVNQGAVCYLKRITYKTLINDGIKAKQNNTFSSCRFKEPSIYLQIKKHMSLNQVGKQHCLILCWFIRVKQH